MRIEERVFLQPIEYISAVWEPCPDPDYQETYREEVRRAGLQGVDISLLTLENGSSSETVGFANGNRSEGYSIGVNPEHPEAKAFAQSPERLMRHELAHIKNGDCDREVPLLLRWLDWAISETRAIFYEYFGRIFARSQKDKDI
jgi:hypothetical protein